MRLIESASSYDDIYGRFRWFVPEYYNIATDVCDRHAAGADGTALIADGPGGVQRFSFGQIQRLANRMAHVFLAAGAQRGDRVMILLGQDPLAAVAHVACWKAGLVSLPTSVLFGVDAVAYRLTDSGAIIALTDLENLPKLADARTQAGLPRTIFLVDGAVPGATSIEAAMARASEHFVTVTTRADEPAFLNYTSGTTGWPKGALHAHRTMLGHMPGAEFGFDFFPQPGDCMWSPADWSWLAGLMDVLMPAWFHGVPVVASRQKKFDPEEAFALMGRHGVRTALLTPTALKLMRQVPNGVARSGTKLRCVLSGGESVGAELLDWASRELRTQVNEAYGQTECNLVLGNCASVMPVKPGSLGRAVPGHVAAIVDDDGTPLPAGAVGNIALRRPDPVMLLEYWRKPDATRDKFAGDWLITGDLGHMDEDGYVWFQGRADDVITSSGYRIGPAEIEDAMTRHPAVVIAAAIGVPDPVRTETIKAFVVLKADTRASPGLADEIRAFVGERLARHECPRDIEFVDELPMTTNGKVIRRALREREAARRT
ncbi:AMP-binding protein [Chelatococcus reniformis]|uniref:Acetyl-CoA synthetase n=1 Tax=Chelatococcus reniformis TaxID=1494448 RepID=A0A916ULU0_9HYPH|nr:AMP-binding protein [Chelatococcus reniformis]GGC77545.1 acetyl-CoA synthetase [Chelatococcus reniformis]